MEWHEIALAVFGTVMAVWVALTNVSRSRLEEKLKLSATTAKAALTAKGVVSQELEVLTDRFQRTEAILESQDRRMKGHLEALTSPMVGLQDASRDTGLGLRYLQGQAKAQRTPFRKMGGTYLTDIVSYHEWLAELGEHDA